MVAIIGVLAAVAIPAYNAYRNNAKEGVVTNSLNLINKTFRACFANGSLANCASEAMGTACTGTALMTGSIVNGTLDIQPGSTITCSIDSGPTVGCFQVQVDDPVDDESHTGCIAFDDDGDETGRTFDDGTDDGTCATGACS